MVWRDMATWIRAYLVYVYLESDSELQQIVIDKLLAIPQDYGNMLRLFFGDTIAEEYTVLLTDYIMLFINLINAQKNGNVKEIDEYTKQLYQNADLRAEYLSNINPFWQKNVLQSLIYNFTDMTIDESTTFLTKDYRRNIEIFDRILSHTSAMGDYLAQGITNYLQYSSRQPVNPR
ncbi:MAG: hypothetical protein AAGU75_02375 [Bacillota bacterium]